MQMTDILARMGGLQSIARELGVSEAEAASGADALLPAILGGFKKQAQASPGGFEGLGGLLGQLGGAGLLDELLGPQPTNVAHGNQVLGSIFGSKDVSRNVAQVASQRTGLDTGLLKQMLPLLAMAVAGYMARQRSAGSGMAPGAAPSGGLGGILGSLLGGQGAGVRPGGTRAETPGWGSLLDMNGDGNSLDDILRMAGKALNR